VGVESFARAAFRVIGGLFFIIGGGLLLLMGMIGAAPSFWYFICFCVFPVVGIVWFWRPSLAAALSIGPLISTIALLRYVSGIWSYSRIWAVAYAAGLTISLVLVVVAMQRLRAWKLPVLLSLTFVCCAFGTDRLFTNKVTVRTYRMYVAANGHAPWGDVGPEWQDGSPPVVLYRRVGNSYCYDAFHSEELRQRLTPKDGQTVDVQYNTFSDFGRQRGYNVRSVDGVLLNDDQHTVRDDERFGGQILGDTGEPDCGR